jgi:hypothetical protein
VLIKPQSWERHGLKPWIEAAKKRLHRNILAIALANKLARIARSVLARGRSFEARPAMARPPKTGPSWIDSHAYPVTHKKMNVSRAAPLATASEIRKPPESPVLDWTQRTILFCRFLSV